MKTPLAWIREKLTPARVPPRVIRANYDAAVITDDNRKHWAAADGLSARQANSPAVRDRLRRNARYETANNCYAAGMADTLADFVVGAGPLLQVERGPAGTSTADNKTVERLFAEWAEAVDLAGDLWTLRRCKAVDGEGMALIRTDVRVDDPVKIRLQSFEAEQCTHGHAYSFGLGNEEVDGIDTDGLDAPLYYRILPYHPAEGYAPDTKPIPVAAAYVLHWFTRSRAGQLRGVPDLTPALPLFSQFRRFTLATLTAAEHAADVSGVLTTDYPANAAPEGDDEFARIEWERGALMQLPNGASLAQFRAEHPQTTYEMFKREILSEAGRCLGLPRAIALGDASGYNYASGRLDYQTFGRRVELEQRHAGSQVLRKVFAAWLAEAQLIEGHLPQSWRNVTPHGPRLAWLWQRLGHVDRAKDANGMKTELSESSTTLAAECAAKGRDWESVIVQRARERAASRKAEAEAAKEFGLAPDPVAAPGVPPELEPTP